MCVYYRNRSKVDSFFAWIFRELGTLGVSAIAFSMFLVAWTIYLHQYLFRDYIALPPNQRLQYLGGEFANEDENDYTDEE